LNREHQQKTVSKERIIVALDVSTAREAREIIGHLQGEVGAFKIGLQLFTAAGAAFVRESVEAGIKIFLDVKFHDIPNTVAKASIEVARLGVWMFNIHTLGGSEMMRRTADDVRETCAKENLRQPKIIGVTVLTSSNSETLREVGIESDTESQVFKLARLASDCGLDGVVASPHEVKLIQREIENKDFLVVAPGVRPAAGNPSFLIDDDQKRVMTPIEALKEGADYLVIGRPIVQTENPASKVREILAEIETASKNNN
jgi:orotidine-5'-phosphate decarboxylase